MFSAHGYSKLNLVGWALTVEIYSVVFERTCSTRSIILHLVETIDIDMGHYSSFGV